MTRTRRTAALLLVATLALAGGAAAADEDPMDYRASIEAWAAHRVESLRRPEGWLSLVGLAWLSPGENTVGSSPDAAVRLPEPAPSAVGTIVLTGQEAVFRPQPGAGVTIDGRPVAEPIPLVSDVEGEPTELELGSLRFYLIQRDALSGIRIKDREAELRQTFDGIERFPVDPSWRIEARFEPGEGTIPVPDVLGQVTETRSPGTVVFSRDGHEARILAMEGGDDGSLFLVFGDPTNGDTTYGGGRFVYTEPPAGDRVVVDFNKAYNPPCVFTPFATCPLPPPGNRLEFPVTAGEKMWAGHH